MGKTEYLHFVALCSLRVSVLPLGESSLFLCLYWRVQAKPYLQAGAYEIVDESLQGSFDIESMRKAALVAIKSVDRDASQRPTIAEVLAELKEAFSIQLSYLASRDMWTRILRLLRSNYFI